MPKLLIDTDVLIDYLRANDEASKFIENLTEQAAISSITVAELYAGVREGSERLILDGFIKAFEVIPLDYAIAVSGGLHRRAFGKSHNVGLADAMIAATAEKSGATLVTLNVKHFPMLDDVHVPYKKN